MSREMKDSGVAWIGEIPENWALVRGKFLFRERNERGNRIEVQLLSPTQRYGVIPQEMYDQISGMKAVKLEGTSDFDALKSIYVGDFCISLRSFQGGFEYSKYNGVVSPAYHVFYKTAELFDGYYRFLFKEHSFIEKMASLTKTFRDGKSISFADFASSFLPVPPLPEQSHIAAFLDRRCAEIDSVIAATQCTIEEYKKLKQSIITEAVTHGVRGPRKMKDSGVEWIGEIPEEWDVVYGHRLISSTQNGLTRRDLDESAGQIVLKLKNITADGMIDYTYVNRINLTEEELSRYSLNDGDFLFVRVNGSKALVGKCAIFSNLDEAVAYNDHIIRVRLNSLIKKRYFQLYLQSSPGRVEIDLRTSTAAGQFTISGEGLRDLQVILPPIEEQDEIAEYTDHRCAEIDRLIEAKQRLLAELEAYKKSVIYEYVTGKREVPTCQ